MKMYHELTDTPKIRQLIRDALASQRGATFNGHTARQYITDVYGITGIDWHVCSYVLDSLCTRKQARVTGYNSDGMEQITINL